jgi:pimeloyl-ACP methyl ester carboxylesterase
MRNTGTVTSRDGTRIAFERAGQGPPIVVVDGLFLYRAIDQWTPRFAQELADRFSVYYYERRGRGNSGDTEPYAVAREVEDLAAVIEEAGGSAYVVGMSSGGVLALEAAATGVPIVKLALYEPPLVVDDSRPPVPDNYLAELKELLAQGRKGDALVLAGVKAVGFPEEMVEEMRNQPFFPTMEVIAPTVAYDGEIMEGLMYGRPVPAERAERWGSISVPTLVAYGAASEEWFHSAAKAVGDAVPGAKVEGLDGQTHEVGADVLAAVVSEHFAD